MMQSTYPFFENNRIRLQKFLIKEFFGKSEKPFCLMTLGLLLIILYQTNDQQGTTTSSTLTKTTGALYQTNDQQGRKPFLVHYTKLMVRREL